jgi:hypothetical protein
MRHGPWPIFDEAVFSINQACLVLRACTPQARRVHSLLHKNVYP